MADSHVAFPSIRIVFIEPSCKIQRQLSTGIALYKKKIQDLNKGSRAALGSHVRYLLCKD